MFTWLKKLLGIGPITPHDTMTVEEYQKHAQKLDKEVKSHVGKVVKVEQAKPVAEPKKEAKKPATKKTAKVDLDSMKKNELLAHAKANGVKANASMNKAEILAAIKG